MTTLRAVASSPAEADVEALAVASAPAGGSGAATLIEGHALPPETAERVDFALKAVRATGGADEVVTLPAVPGVSASVVLVCGMGALEAGQTAYGPEALRRAAGAAARASRGRANLAIAFPASGELAAAVCEGALLGAYRYAGLHQPAPDTDEQATSEAVQQITLLTSAEDLAGAETHTRRASVLAAAHEWARDLVNTPPNLLYPQSFAEAVQQRAQAGTVEVDVLDEAALRDGGFGGTIGVGQGSERPPRIVTMTYAPAQARATLALVGKGITFDSGGLNIKPGPAMATMKCDMAGAAAVAATVLAAAELELPVAVTGYLCLAENMLGGGAQRPGDVVTMRGGTTVEIVNTDAEGRMVLGDGIALACETPVDAVVDIATLTGHAVVALGKRIAALMAGDDAFRDRVRDAADAAGEAFWPMPLPGELRSQLDSPVADLVHMGDRMGGMLIAGLFLKEFVGTRADGSPIPWAHLDIAGPAFNEDGPFGYTPKGGTGFGIRTLIGLVESYA